MPGTTTRAGKTNSGWRGSKYRHTDGTVYPCQILSGTGPYTIRIPGLRQTIAGVAAATTRTQTGVIFKV
jgi:hypothetical protein